MEAAITTSGPVGIRGTALLTATPESAATRPNRPASGNITPTESVHCRAVTGGITTRAVTSTAPAAGSPTTTITATSTTNA